jgi:hypothetical protein
MPLSLTGKCENQKWYSLPNHVIFGFCDTANKERQAQTKTSQISIVLINKQRYNHIFRAVRLEQRRQT